MGAGDLAKQTYGRQVNPVKSEKERWLSKALPNGSQPCGKGVKGVCIFGEGHQDRRGFICLVKVGSVPSPAWNPTQALNS